MYGSETTTRREVRQIRTVNGQVVEDTRDIDYETFSPKRSKGYENEYNDIFNGGYAQDREPLRTREMNFQASMPMQRSFDAGYTKKAPSDAGSESSDRGSYSTGRDSPRRRGSAGSQTKSSSISMPIKSGSLTRMENPTYPDGKVTYNISIKVAEVKGDGSNGNVYVTLFGDKATTSKIQLREAGDNRNAFIGGEMYTFSVNTDDVGKVDRIKLSHDHMDFGSGFLVDEVQVQIPAHNEDYTFPCNFWLSQERHDSLPRPEPPAPVMQGYTVSLELGRVYNPNAKLYLQICGSEGDSGKIVLRPTGGNSDEFLEGKVYKFSVQIPTVGKVNKVRIGHDSRGRDKGIYIDEIEVIPDGEDTIFFPAACWLAEDIGDGKLEREIFMGHAPTPIGTDATHTVSVRLGEVLNYNAQLYVYLIGTLGETSRVPLKPDGLLDRGKVYKFPLALNVDIGRITKIVLGQNSRGYGQGLFVDEVDVQPTNGVPVNFPCRCWLAEDVWDSCIERELQPGIPVERPPNTTYELMFVTSDCEGAGTDANVTLQLFGERGQTEKIMLRQKGRTLKRFDRGRTDRFDVQTMDVGKIYKVRLSHDNSGGDPNWHLEKLNIGVPERNEKCVINVNGWLKGEESDALVQLDMKPVYEEPIFSEEQQPKVITDQLLESALPEPDEVLYTVSFTLGPHTDPFSRIYLILHGVDGDSERVYLKPPHGSKLTSGKPYKIITKIPDVGKIECATVGLDAPTPDKKVFVETLDIAAPAETPTEFPCRAWLSEQTPELRLFPGKTQTYEVLFKLGEVLDPDTKLWMIIYGDTGDDSGKLYLYPRDGSKFKKNTIYKVIAKMRDIGNIKDVLIGKEGEGAVFVEEIKVWAAGKDPVVFPCRAWVDDSHPTGTKLRPGESLTTPYEIEFTLGEVLNPDAELYMVIHGNEGDSDKFRLLPSPSPRFETGHTYRVCVDLPNIGEIDEVELFQEGPGKGLFVEEVTVHPKDKDPVVFPCRVWLDDSEMDGQKTRTLRPGHSFTTPYTVIFTLGEVINPDAKLYMVIHGSEDDSDKLYLTTSDGKPFKKGETYKVVFNIPDVGQIENVEIGVEGVGGVFVEEVEIRAPGQKPVVFPSKCWLDDNQSDGQTSRVLMPNEPVVPKYEDILYNATFETGDYPTDGNVYLQMCGDKTETGKIEFNQGDGKGRRYFQRGKKDKFAVETVDIGKMEKIRVGHDGHPSSEWFLKQLTIDIPSKDECYVFPFNNWVKGGEDIEMDPAELYTIMMKVGDVLDPDAPVLIQLLGNKGESGQIQVKPGVKPTDKFERWKTYKLVAKVNDLGPIRGVRVSQDELVPSRGLFVEEVEVTNSRGDKYVFPVNCWTVPDDKVKIPETTYEAVFFTGDHPNSGTNANVFFQLFGDEARTEEVQLSDGKTADLFKPCGTDTFKIDTSDVGKIESLRVGHDNSGKDPEWFLKQVVINVPDKQESYAFDINQWIGGRNACVDARPVKLKDLDYRVAITTGNDPDAGTDANVFLQMYGEKGASPKFLLREEGDRIMFDRARTDEFSFRNKDIGKLKRIRLSRDNSGVKPGWLVEKVTIDIPERKEHYEFTCNQWLRAGSQPADFDVDSGDLYTVVTKVGEVRDPGVRPWFNVCGEKGETGKINLRDGYKLSHQFLKDHTYKISVKCPDVGKIDLLRIGDDGGGRGRTMYVEDVTVINKNGDETVFPAMCWLGTDEHERPLVYQVKPGEPVSAQEDLYYHLTIMTADDPNAGTDAQAYFRLYGEKGETSDIVLTDENKFIKFSPGRADKFVVQTADVGKLYKMVIGHNDTSGDPDKSWFLEEVDVDIPARNEHYVFKCGQVLEARGGKDNTEVVLYPEVDKPVEDLIQKVEESGPLQGAAPTEPDNRFFEDTDYELEFHTADKRNAGTDCSVHCQMIGEDGPTKEIQLGDNRDARHFQRGQVDKFEVRAQDVGKLRTFRVGHDNDGKKRDWMLDEVVVIHRKRKERYVFKNNRRMDGANNQVDIPLDCWNYLDIEGEMPDIPDLLDYMQNGEVEKKINAGFYLQHLCYQDDDVKDKVRSLSGIPIIVYCLTHNNDKVRHAAACVLRNLSSGSKTDQNKFAITDCGGIERLMEALQRAELTEHRNVILVVLRNLSILAALRLRILKVCLHLLVIIIIKTYSGWTRADAQREPAKTDSQWSELLRHATRIVRNLSSAGAQAREDLRTEEYLIDCLVWIVRVGVRNKRWNDECVENCVCTLRNLSYRLESELDRDIYTDDEVELDKAVVKQQQSQGCFAGCGGGKSKKKKKAKQDMPDNPMITKGPPTGPALLYQPTTVRQYFILLKNATNDETLEGSAGALHNLTACSWKWAIKIRGDARREQAIPSIINLLKSQYDPAVRASAIFLRNLSVDLENKRIIGEKGTGPLVNRLPTGEPREEKSLSDATHVSIMCALYQLGKKSDKNARILRKTTGIRRMVRIANSKDRYDQRMVRTANQTLASLSAHEGLKEQMKKEGWELTEATKKELSENFPDELDKISAPSTPNSMNRSLRDQRPRTPDSYNIERQPEMYRRSPSADSAGRESLSRRQTADRSDRGSTTGSHQGSEMSDRTRSLPSSTKDIPPPYISDDSMRGSRGEVYEMRDRKPNTTPRNTSHDEERGDDWV